MNNEEKEYVLMCEMAEEIQENWIAEVGDFFVDLYIKKKRILVITDKAVSEQIKIFKKNKVKHWRIWLPSQGQLQDIVFDDNWKSVWVSGRIEYFWKWVKKVENHKIYSMRFESMEQLWLAFVMYELYGKIWNGENWLKINKKGV